MSWLFIEKHNTVAIYFWDAQDEWRGYWFGWEGEQQGSFTTVVDAREAIDVFMGEPEPEPEPEEPEPEEPEPEEPELIETYRDIDIYWLPTANLFRAQVAAGYLAVGETLDEVKLGINEILEFLEPAPEGEWPWPMNGVQEWFGELWNNVLAAPVNAVQSFWDAHILPKLDWIKDRLSESIEWVYDQLRPIISHISTAIGDVWTGVTTEIANMWSGLSAKITNIGDWIWQQVEPAITAVTTAMNEALKGISTFTDETFSAGLNLITTNLTSISTALSISLSAGLEWVGTHVTSVVADAAKTINDGMVVFNDSVKAYVMDAVAGGMDWVTNALSGVARALGDGLSNWFDGILKSIGNTAEMIFGAVNFVIAKLREGVTWLLGDFLNALTNALSPGSPPEPIRVAASVLAETNWERQMEMIDAAYESNPTAEGLQRSAINLQMVLMGAAVVAIGTGLAADLAHPIKGMGFRPTVREMVYWAGIPSVTAAIAVMPTSIGLLEPLRYELNSRWMPHIPPANDLVRFALREVWDEERREALIAFYPGEHYTDLMSKHGYRPEFAENYWMAHWVLPSIGQLNEMLYRGKIDEDVWENFVRYNDIIPEMIPNLKEIIYKPYTRVDTRRMWDLGILTDDEILENYKWLGYDDEHAETMAIWTKAYVIAGDIRALYSKGWIDENGARLMVLEAGIPAERADVFLKRLVRVEQPTRMEGERELTKTDILRMLKINILTEPQTIDMLIGLGYDENEAFYLVQLYTYIGEIDLKELTMAQILKAYRYEIYDRDKAKFELEDSGWSTEAAETLMVLEDVKLRDAQTERARERDLTRTDITKSINAEILEKETGILYLGYLGYSEWEISVILALAGIE